MSEPENIEGEMSIDAFLKEIRERLTLFESSLPNRVDGFALCQESKLPWKALCYRESLIWRIVELGQVALECFETKKIASAILLTRAAMETCAALCYLSGKLETTIQSKSVGDIDDYLMKLLMGSKIDLDILPPAISVMAFLDKVDKEGHFRRMYECLCEYAHPNYRGTGFLYSKNDEANLWTDFGANIRGEENSMKIGLNSLSLALMLFEDKYDRIGESMPAFVTLCKTVTGDSKSS